MLKIGDKSHAEQQKTKMADGQTKTPYNSTLPPLRG